jgi:lipid A 3-O-deacylase
MKWLLIGISTLAVISLQTADADSSSTNETSQANTLTLQHPEIWDSDVGDGFRKGVQSISLQTGFMGGVAIFGGRQEHELAILSVSYGDVISKVDGKDHWYQGNWELRGEFFGAAQVSPTRDWVVGLTPHLRYDFATGTRWVPYVDGGAGVSATGIGHPDLDGTFEFNLQLNTGVQWFIRDDFAITLEEGYLHMSDAGINHPNQGLNGIRGMLGATWFF